MLRKVFGAFLNVGCLRNFDSLTAKKRFCCGLVMVLLDEASFARSFGATSARLGVLEGVSGTNALDRRENDLGGGEKPLFGSESLLRE